MCRLRRLILLLALSVRFAVSADVLTANYGPERTNANLHETVLTPDAVSAHTFGKVFTLPVDGFIYAQPLYVGGWEFPGRGVHNVVLVATMHNSVYAFDADTPADPLWQVNLGPSVPATDYDPDFRDIVPEVGILSTPVADRAAGVLYAVAATAAGGKYFYHLHALDLTSGEERFGAPVEIRGESVVSDGAGGAVTFDPFQHIQRPGLLLANGTVYVAFGAHADMLPFHGWIFGFDAHDLRRQVASFSATPLGMGASVWQSGRGLAADQAGQIYASTGNGDFDGSRNFGQSVLKLGPFGELPVLDWFTPGNWEFLNDRDEDFGSAGPVLIPGSKLLVTGSKRGWVYLLDRDRLGGLEPDDTQIVQSFRAVSWGIFNNVAVWPRPDGAILYTRGIADSLRAFRLKDDRFETEPFSISSIWGGVPFDGLVVSANGSEPGSGIVWMTMADLDGHPVPGTLYALDAEDLERELWNSSMEPERDRLGLLAKFAPPTVANGKVYVPTFSHELVVYGLLDACEFSPAQPPPAPRFHTTRR